MMKTNASLLCLVLTLSLMPGLGGCETRNEPVATQPPPLSNGERSALLRQTDRSCENADLADMAVCDFHFLPDRDILSSTGTARLNRLAWLVDRYGGGIVLDFAEPKSALAKARMKTVEQYLLALGLAKDKIKLTMDLPKSQGMQAAEAMKIYDDTRYQSEKKQGINLGGGK